MVRLGNALHAKVMICFGRRKPVFSHAQEKNSSTELGEGQWLGRYPGVCPHTQLIKASTKCVRLQWQGHLHRAPKLYVAAHLR